MTTAEVTRLLGIELTAGQIAEILTRLEFTCQVKAESVLAKTPPHRLDIGTGVVGKADLLEEVARIYGYDNIPPRRLPSELPKPFPTPVLDLENQTRQLLVRMGLQEVINYRLTTPEREARLYQAVDVPEREYVWIKNPLSPERAAMRRSLLASVLDILEKNVRLRDRLALFEVGPEFYPRPGEALPEERQKVVVALTGLREIKSWDSPDHTLMDYFDLKGILEGLLDGLHVKNFSFTPGDHPSFHPGKCATVQVDGVLLGTLGELHPKVKESYDFLNAPVLAAELDLTGLLEKSALRFETHPVPIFPPTLEDIAVVVEEGTPAAEVEAVIRQGRRPHAGGCAPVRHLPWRANRRGQEKPGL